MERFQDRRLRLALGATIAAAALSGCGGSPDRPAGDGPIGGSSRPDLTCSSAGLFTDYGNGERYLSVNVDDTDGHEVQADSAELRELETQRTHRYELSDNQAPVSISRRAVQVAVSVAVGKYDFACPTIYYPNRTHR